ncbi:MAG TPA: ABC transporter ATP-binding protein [Polyangiaceae bacterium]|nr:ABC transporter ATP-binding protein [Polyangiaceae bacterium]
MTPLLNTSRKRFGAFQRARASTTAAGPAVEPAARSVQARRYWVWLRPELLPLVLVLVLSLFGIAIDMVWPLVSAHLIDHVILKHDLSVAQKTGQLFGFALGMSGLLLVGAGLSWLRTLRLQLLNSQLAFRLRSTLFHRVLRLPMSELNEMKTGGILSRLSNDVDGTTGLLQQALLSPLLATLRLLATLTIIFSLNWRMASAVLLVLPPILLVQNLWARKIRVIWKSMGQDRQEIDARVSEGLSGVRIVRGFGREQREELAYMVGHHTVIRKQMLATRTQRSVALIWELLLPIGQVTIIAFGGFLVVRGLATVGTLIAFQGYMWRLLEPAMQLSSSINETQRGLASMDRVFDVLDKAEEKPDVPGAVLAPARVEEIRFDHVSFSYRADLPVVRDFDLTVPGGSVVALVGASGAGKTTVTDLLARFYDPSAGRILLNGIDLRDIRLKSFRSRLGIVQQEVFLFDGSVRENIAYGRIQASEEEVLDAARRANADEFIRRLPEGYDTLIGERGVKLSGGQRQRLSIARALLADPQILILDEATSSLDTESEQLIQASLDELLRDRTTFVIAHRLSTIAHADIIVVLEAGVIVEQGTHLELLRRGGRYADMVARQAHARPAEQALGSGQRGAQGAPSSGTPAGTFSP